MSHKSSIALLRLLGTDHDVQVKLWRDQLTENLEKKGKLFFVNISILYITYLVAFHFNSFRVLSFKVEKSDLNS